MKIKKSTIKLGKQGAKLRMDISNEIQLEESHDFARLDLLAHTFDQIFECETTIKKEGIFIKDRFEQSRENPALKTQRDLKVVFCRILRELNLDVSTGKESRIPSLY